MKKTYEPCSDGCLGWCPIDSQDGRGEHIEKCDSCERFEYDDEAVAFVYESYSELLSAARTIIDYHTPELSGGAGFAELVIAVDKAEGKPQPKFEGMTVKELLGALAGLPLDQVVFLASKDGNDFGSIHEVARAKTTAYLCSDMTADEIEEMLNDHD